MNMESITDINVRNKNARQQVINVSESNGISYSFMARQMNTSPSSFNHWRGCKYEYSKDKLNQIESIIKKFSFNG